jgi:catechol 2,3-dioxygenase-like lactoylglutathione lyase family enzyme
MISTLFHVNLVVSDMDRSLSFYQALGFVPVGEAVPEDPELGAPLGTDTTKMRSVFLRLGTKQDGPMLDLVQILAPAAHSRPYPQANHLGIARVAFWTNDLQAAIRCGQAVGGRLLGHPIRFPGPEGKIVDSACLADPDGIFIQAFAPAGENA